jgi:hypothetical protein
MVIRPEVVVERVAFFDSGGAYDTSVLSVAKISAVLCSGNTTLSQPGRLIGGERNVASAKILSRRILQAEAPGASSYVE